MRLTIAVELVAKPSIIFMVAPTTGLDARATAIIVILMQDEQLFVPSTNQELKYLKHLMR